MNNNADIKKKKNLSNVMNNDQGNIENYRSGKRWEK